MKELEEQLNYSLVIYNSKEEVFEKLDGEGDCGMWLRYPDSPDEAALFVVNREKADKYLQENGYGYYFAGRIPYDESDVEHPEKEEKGVLVKIGSKEEAMKIAKKIDVDFFYWIYWNPARVIEVVDVKTGERELYCDGDMD